LRQAVLLALTAFPYAILPNTLVREMRTLAKQAALDVPLVEEVAADIFMGTFTVKWRRAAEIASKTLVDSLYARYYDLPGPEFWAEQNVPRRLRFMSKWGKETAEDFAALCNTRAGVNTDRSVWGSIAQNGMVLEQSQILTTHNLAALVEALDLPATVRELAPELATRIFAWLVRRHTQPSAHWHAGLIMVKNTAYAWRQASFLLSFCDQDTTLAVLARLRDQVEEAGLADRLRPAVAGLAHVVAGGRFTTDGTVDGGTGRRFLGWTVGEHWCLAEPR
jgi:hypothetical protein